MTNDQRKAPTGTADHVVPRKSHSRDTAYDNKPRPITKRGGGRGVELSIRHGVKPKVREAERIAFVGDMVDAWETAVKLGDVAGMYGVIRELALAGAVSLAVTYERSMG